MDIRMTIATVLDNETFGEREEHWPGGPYKRSLFEDEIPAIAEKIAAEVRLELDREAYMNRPTWQEMEALNERDWIVFEFLAHKRYQISDGVMFTRDQIAAIEAFRDFMIEHGLTDGDAEGEFERKRDG